MYATMSGANFMRKSTLISFLPLILPLMIAVICYFLFFHSSSSVPWLIEFFENGSVKSLNNSLNSEESGVSEGYGFGVYYSYDPEVGMNLTQFLAENESLEGYIAITNAIHADTQYLLFMLVDYGTVPFYVEGHSGLTHLLTLKPMEKNFYHFRLENLSKGYHDVIIGAFLNPYEHSLDTEYRMSTDFALMGRIRFNVIVGNSYYPLPELNNPEIFCNRSYVLEGLIVTKEPCSPTGWFSENVTKGQKLEYFINIGNNENEQRSFAVIQFLDYKQIPIQYNSQDYVYYGYLLNGDKASIPASLIVPNETGIHELIVVWVSDPYQNVEISRGVMNARIENRVEPSIRIGLSVS